MSSFRSGNALPAVCLGLAFVLAACSSPAPRQQSESAPAEPVDHAPQMRSDLEIARIPDAEPRHETRTRAGNANPYTVFGKTYHLLPDSKGYREQGTASWYGMKFHGRATANGERYDVFGMTAAHRTLPIPSYVRVTNLENQRSIVVRVNDRGPFHGNRIIDLSWVAARKLGFAERGTARVEVVAVEPGAPAPPVLNYATADERSAPTPVVAPPQSTAGESVEPASAPPAPRWYFQVGAYRDYSVAQRLHLALGEHLPGQVVIDSERNDGFHRVRVGPLADAESMQRVRQVLAAQQIDQPLLVSD